MSFSSSIVILTFFAVCHSLTPSSFLSVTDKHRLQKIFESEAPYTDVKNLHYSVKGLKVLNVAIPKEKEACSFLQNKASIVLDLEDLYHVTSGAEYLGNCALPALNNGDVQKKLDESLVDNAKIEDIFYATITMKNLKLQVPATKIKKIVDGIIKKDSSVNVESYAFHVIAQLGIEKKDIATYVEDISDVVKQADEYNNIHLFYDSGLFSTAFVIEGIFSLSQSAGIPPKGLDANSLIKFTNYLLSRRHTYQLKSAAQLTSALHVIAKNAFITPVCIQLLDLTARGVSESQPLIQVRLVNALGEAFSKDNIQQLVASSVSSAIGTNDSVTILSMEVFKLESDGVYSLDLFSRVKQRPSRGMYKVQLTITEASTAGKPKLAGLTGQSVNIKVTGEIVVEGVELSVRDPLDQKAATGQSALLKFMSKASNQLDLDHQQKLVVRFTAKDKIPGPGPKEGSLNSGVISQAFIRLYQIESKVEYIVNVASTPPAPFANSADIVEYRLLFDPAAHLPKNYQAGLYQLDLILGDAFISNPVQWTMADLLLQTSGVDAGKKKTVDDKRPKPDMDHMFREPDKRAPFPVALTFTILCALPFFIMLILWIKIGVNISNMPCGINALGFHGGCLAIFVLYGLYWFKLDMFQTLKCLTIISLFTMFFGLRLLQSVAAKRQKS